MAAKAKTPALSRAEKQKMMAACRTIIRKTLPALDKAEATTALAKLSELEVTVIIGKALLQVEPAFADSKAFLAFAIKETKRDRSWVYNAKAAASALNTHATLNLDKSGIGDVQALGRFNSLSENEAQLVLAATKQNRSYANVSKAIANVKSNTRNGDSAAVKARKRAEKVAKVIGPVVRRKVGNMTADEAKAYIATLVMGAEMQAKHRDATVPALQLLTQAIQKGKRESAKAAK
jgi:hypothetical protein